MSKNKQPSEKGEGKTIEKKITPIVQLKEDDSIKPSTSKSISLMDNLVQSQKKAIPERKKQNESSTYASKAIPNLAPKNFVFKKKKSKKFSAMKRRILNERLKIYINDQLHQEALFEKVDQNGASIRIYNFCNGADWSDSDEINEYANNVLELLSSIESINRINVWKNKTVDSATTEDHFIEVEFNSKTLADVAVNMLEGLNLGGDIIKAVLHTKDDTARDEYATEISQAIESSDLASQEPIILILENFVTTNDFEDQEELEEIVQDIYNLCLPFSRIESLWVEHNRVRPPTTTLLVPTHNLWSAQLTTISNHMISISLSSFEATYNIMKTLNQREIAGQQLCCYFYDPHYRNIPFEHQHLCRIFYTDIGKQQCSNEFNEQQIYVALVIKQFTSIESLQDEDEKEELISNLQDIVLSCLEIDDSPVLYNELLFVSPSAVVNPSIIADVYLLWKMEMPMMKVYQALRRKVIGGSELYMELKTVNIAVLELSQETAIPILTEDEVRPYINTIMKSTLGYSTPDTVAIYSECTLLIDNYITEEDIQEVCNDAQAFQDTIQVFKQDLLQIIHDFPTVGGGKAINDYITQVKYLTLPSITPMAVASSSTASASTVSAAAIIDPNPVDEACRVCIQLDSLSAIQKACLYFDGLKIGGQSLSAYSHPCWLHPSDDEEDVILKEEIFQQMLSNQSVHGKGVSINMTDYECIHFVEPSLPPPSSVTPLSEIIDPEIQNTNSSMVLMNLRKKYFEDHQVMEKNPVLSKYKLAKEIPRLGKHQTPALPIPVASEEINIIIKEFLRLISTFQARNKEKFPPLKYKAKLRFVAGMKQVLNAVKMKHVRIVFIAPNTDVSEELDDKLALIIAEAQRRDMDIMYCLSKRLLGKALQMSMKQSAVAVLDPDGAFELYRKISAFIRIYPKMKALPITPVVKED